MVKEDYSQAFANAKEETKPELWADHMILKLDNQMDSDMLPYVWKGANLLPIEVDNGFMPCFYRRGEKFMYFVRNKDIIFIKYVKYQ